MPTRAGRVTPAPECLLTDRGRAHEGDAGPADHVRGHATMGRGPHTIDDLELFAHLRPPSHRRGGETP
ncbi:hypothetical protein [Streptomyces sp. NPDC004546]|uniref:hypothetical protein n=1 Tax=Streptomyces sp. NPDC004546 TaxID=3154282 RepID=UPI0033AB7F26